MASQPSLVARRVREIREAKKLSRQQLADIVALIRRPDGSRPPCTYLQVYRIETGVTELAVDDVPRYAEALDVSVASLYRESRAAS